MLNCSLKTSDEVSNTESLLEESKDIFSNNNIETESVRVADYHIGYGITHEKINENDQWPELF